MKILRFLLIAFFVSALMFQSCQKEFSLEKAPTTLTESQLLESHQSTVKTWMKLIPLNGKFVANSITTKTIKVEETILTNIQIGENGNSLLFISNKNKFHVYGINSKQLKKTTSHDGGVTIYDFQNFSKYKLFYSENKLTKIGITDGTASNFNAYKGIYKISNRQVSARTQGGSGILSSIRKFFCELFGGYWAGSVAENRGTSGSCLSSGGGGSDPEEPTTIIAPGSGGSSMGNIFSLINNPNYFDINSGIWYSVLPWTNGGGGSGAGTNWNGNTMFIDTACSNPDDIRCAFFALHTQQNQHPPTVMDGSIQEMLQSFEAYKNQEQVLIPIIPWLIKAGANGAADALMQSLFIYLTEDDCPSFGAAFGHDKFSKTQVARSTAEGLIPWRTPGGKLGRAGFTAIGDILVNLVDGKYGESNYQQMGYDFMLGFFSDLAGGAAGELASKYALPKIGKGLLNKFGIHYKTVASWLGGGLEQINKSFLHNGQTITASRVMKGFAENKVVVIGRNMDERVVPFAQKLSQDLGFNVVTIKQWSGWNSNLTVEQNKEWLQKLKNEGYTFYDVGLDPSFTSIGNFSEGAYYSMELNEIFR